MHSAERWTYLPETRNPIPSYPILSHNSNGLPVVTQGGHVRNRWIKQNLHACLSVPRSTELQTAKDASRRRDPILPRNWKQLQLHRWPSNSYCLHVCLHENILSVGSYSRCLQYLGTDRHGSQGSFSLSPYTILHSPRLSP